MSLLTLIAFGAAIIYLAYKVISLENSLLDTQRVIGHMLLGNITRVRETDDGGLEIISEEDGE
jgi:hypothetical protein